MRGLLISFLLLFSTIHADPCPSGYTQAPNDGDCYKIRTYYDSFIGQFYPTTFDDVELDCNSDGGGMLASIHSKEENDFVASLEKTTLHGCGNLGSYWVTNIGLRCIGKECKWDDGSPLTYTNFNGGSGPSDDGRTRCYGLWDDTDDPQWTEKGCGKYQENCWVCSVKARTIECSEGETAYKDGCLSVHTSPLNQTGAEASCPGGGHLVSIHSEMENAFYAQMALYAGVTGTIYIGGQFSNGVFEWNDGSYYNYGIWANGFPNTVFGTCTQMLLSSEFGVQGQWTNVDCNVKQPYLCFRNGGVYGPTAFPPPPKADAKCPALQYYTGTANIFSPNYPLSIPNQQSCEYVLGAKEDTRASVRFLNFDCQSGTYLALFDGLNSNEPFMTFTTIPPVINQSYTATTNVMKMVFTASGPSEPVGTGWEAEFTSV